MINQLRKSGKSLVLAVRATPILALAVLCTACLEFGPPTAATPTYSPFPTAQAVSLPEFLNEVWPPPNSTFALESYENNLQHHFCWSCGIGVDIRVNVINAAPWEPEMHERAELFVDGRKFGSEEIANSFSWLMFAFYVDEEGQIYKYDPGATVLDWHPELTAGEHEARILIPSFRGEDFGYTWRFTIVDSTPSFTKVAMWIALMILFSLAILFWINKKNVLRGQ